MALPGWRSGYDETAGPMRRQPRLHRLGRPRRASGRKTRASAIATRRRPCRPIWPSLRTEPGARRAMHGGGGYATRWR